MSTEEKFLDITQVPPPMKHPTIFITFDELKKDESFILINDHDPMPLKYQFTAERPNQYGWEYLEQGPMTWKVRISKVV